MLNISDTASSAPMWATTRQRISVNVLAGFLISASMNGPAMNICLKAWVDHQGFILGLELHYERPKLVQIILQRLTLPLLHAEKIKGDRWSGLVNNELFPEQLRKLVEGGDVAVKKAIEPLQSCAYERTYEHREIDGVCSS